MLDKVKDSRHKLVLNWFLQNAGKVVSWPQPLEGGILVACKPKGIYKPAWSEYALSVRHALGSTYNDELYLGPEILKYDQEEQEGRDPRMLFTNKGLLACMRDSIPVGILVQESARPIVKYRVLGIAEILDYSGGIFSLRMV